MRIGIPRALLFYAYYPAWSTFFHALGHETVVSRETTKGTLDRGVRLAVEETCLPVKVFYGHCAELLDEGVDRVFVPRLVSVDPRSYICPKFMGLPDMMRHALPGRDVVLDVNVDLRSKPRRSLWRAAVDLGRQLGASEGRVAIALARSTIALSRFEREAVTRQLDPCALLAGDSVRRPNTNSGAGGASRPRLGILGHPYNLYDSFINMNLQRTLATAGFDVITPEMVSRTVVERRAKSLPKDLFWTFGRRVYGAAEEWLATGKVAGLVHLVSFGCGPDSLVGELVQRRARHLGETPFLLLTVDEHTGPAGVITRLEAFADMIGYRASGQLGGGL